MLSKACDIYFDNHKVGSMRIRQEGLFYILECYCRFKAKAFYRVIVEHTAGTTDLGICIPDADIYYIQKKIAKKFLPGDKWRVYAIEYLTPETAIIIDPDKRFRYLSKLNELRFIPPYAYFKARSLIPQDNGRTP